MDRRTSLKWMLSAAALPLVHLTGCSSEPPPKLPSGVGYGTDPDLLKVYGPGSVWPLTLSELVLASRALEWRFSATDFSSGVV